MTEFHVHDVVKVEEESCVLLLYGHGFSKVKPLHGRTSRFVRNEDMVMLRPCTRDDLMEKTRAAHTFAFQVLNTKQGQMAAYLSVFHPDIEPGTDRWREVLAAVEEG